MVCRVVSCCRLEPRAPPGTCMCPPVRTRGTRTSAANLDGGSIADKEAARSRSWGLMAICAAQGMRQVRGVRSYRPSRPPCPCPIAMHILCMCIVHGYRPCRSRRSRSRRRSRTTGHGDGVRRGGTPPRNTEHGTRNTEHGARIARRRCVSWAVGRPPSTGVRDRAPSLRTP
jgi:hypothetical protein